MILIALILVLPDVKLNVVAVLNVMITATAPFLNGEVPRKPPRPSVTPGMVTFVFLTKPVLLMRIAPTLHSQLAMPKRTNVLHAALMTTAVEVTELAMLADKPAYNVHLTITAVTTVALVHVIQELISV